MISKESKERILKRLQQENARSPYLNSLPGRLNSYSKLDFSASLATWLGNTLFGFVPMFIYLLYALLI